jgi:hypothetical protein
MPNSSYGTNLYPVDKDAYDRMLSWCLRADEAAQSARRPYEEIWERAYKLYRCYVNRDRRDWRSKVFMPETFQTIETILPRMVAQLPRFLVNPRGPDDVSSAKVMEQLLEWSTQQSKLHLQLIDVFKDMLMYGTGILKTKIGEIPAYSRKPVPIFQDEVQVTPVVVTDPDTQEPLLDTDGNPVVEQREEVISVPVGEEMQRYRWVKYDGPLAEAIDIFNFWVAPEAEDIQSARYVIHRTLMEWSEVKRLIDDGTYVVPEDFDETVFWDQSAKDAHAKRQDSIDLGPGNDSTRQQVEIKEYWTNDGPNNPGRTLVVANGRLILRVQENPFDHGEKPFIRFVDYKQPHEFWGVGEIEIIQGLQDLENALVNQRVDNVRLSMDRAYVVNVNQLEDRSDLTRRPGQVIRVKGDGMRPEDVVKPLDFGDVTSSAFAEVDQTQRMIERATSVSAYQQGLDSTSMNDTATGISIITEQGGSRFAMKIRQAELMGLETLGYHYASNLQQFTSEPRMVRLTTENGEFDFKFMDPTALHGEFDYSIEPASIQQSETVRRDQALALLRELSPYFQMQGQIGPDGQPMQLPPGIKALIDDLLDAFGKKDKASYFASPAPAMLPPAPADVGAAPEAMTPELLAQLSQQPIPEQPIQ